MADKKRFLEEHRSEIIQNTRNPIQLADKLLEKKCINEEMYNNIKTQSTSQDQTRAIYDCLKAKKHFACAYDWLKENESELFKELEKINAEAAEPPEKQARLENEDEADNNITGFPDLSMISTFAKLEDWVSKPENSQMLIRDFKEKHGDEGMEALEKELKDKEPKKTLCFNAFNIDEIRKNKELDIFLRATKSKTIPKLTYSMFFRKASSVSSGSTAQSSNDKDSMHVTAGSDSSGRSSFLSLNVKEKESQRINLPNVTGDGENPSCQTGQIINPYGSMNMQETPTQKEQPQRFIVPNLPRTSVSVEQNDHVTKKETLPEDGYGTMDTQDTRVDEEPQTSNISKHEDVSVEDVCGSANMQKTPIHEIPQRLNVSNVPHIKGESESLGMQDKDADVMDDYPQRSNVPDDPGSGDIYPCQTGPITKKAAPLEDEIASKDIQNAHTDYMEEQPQTSDVPLHENKSGTQKAAPLEDTCRSTNVQKAQATLPEDGYGAMDTQDTHIDEEPQTSSVSKHEDESVEDTCESTNLQETPIHEIPERLNVPNVPHIKGQSESFGMQDKDADEMDEEPQRSNVLTHEDKLIENTRESMSMQETRMNDMKEQPQRFNVPDVPHTGVSVHRTDQATNITQLEDASESMDTQDEHIDQIYEEPQRSKVPAQKDESIIKKTPPLEDGLTSLDMQDTYTDKMDDVPQTSQMPVEGRDQSMQQHKASKTPKKRSSLKSQREEKKREKNKLLHDWALEQCHGTKEELKGILGQISIIDMAEHSSYPCYTAEDVMVYKRLTPDSRMIFISDDNTAIRTMTTVHYYMFVCSIKKAVLLGPKEPNEQVIEYNEPALLLKKCHKFIFKAFAPALAVYKKIQKEERLYSLV